jgi:UDP-glucose 4-epimerase
MKYLVTGGCGFIGTNLVHRIFLEDKEAEVFVVDDLSKGKIENLHPSASLYRGNITDSLLAFTLCRCMDVVVHLAANTGVIPSIEDPRKDCESNVLGTFNYLEASARNNVKKFIFASSGGAAVGDKKPPINEEIVPKPISPYGASKVAGEVYCSAFYGSYGLDTYALRFSNVYGPHSENKDGNLIPKYIMAAIKKEPFYIYGDGKQTRDFIYVGDLVRAIMAATKTESPGGEVFQVATNKPTSVLDVVRMLNRISLIYLKYSPEVIFRPGRKGEVKDNHADISKVKNILGFEPEVDLYNGLEKTFLWFMENVNERF